ncbi:MAG: aldehyde dehydrogenase family protein, partial [Candidatus Krumholzibacteriia bacterium]
MSDAMYDVPFPQNEPILGYLHGSPEKAELKAELKRLAGEQIEIPLVIGGQEVRTGALADCVMPHDHRKVLGRYHKAGEKEVRAAVRAAVKAKKGWAATPFAHRAAILL